MPTSESHRFEKNGGSQIDEALAGQKISEAEGFLRRPRRRWSCCDRITFSRDFRPQNHKKRLMFCHDVVISRLSVIDRMVSANRNHFRVLSIFSPPERPAFCVASITQNSGDTKIISVCRVSIANYGGAGGCKSISRGTESQVFRGHAAGKRMRTRSSRSKANVNPCLVDFLTSEGIVNLPQSDFLGSMLLRRWQ